MGLRDLIANGVALADQLTADLQPTIRWSAWLGNDGFGGNEYAQAVDVPAIVELKQKLVRNAAGEEVMSSHAITILRPLPDTQATGRVNPIDTRDRIVLSDGTTGVIINVEGFQDSKTQGTYFSQVWLANG